MANKPKLPKGTMRLRLQVRHELTPRKEYPKARGFKIKHGDEPSAEEIKRTRRTQTSQLAKYLREGPIKKSWTGKAISNIKIAGRLAGKLGAIGQIATLPSQVEEYKERMKPLSKKEQERSARGI